MIVTNSTSAKLVSHFCFLCELYHGDREEKKDDCSVEHGETNRRNEQVESWKCSMEVFMGVDIDEAV